MLSEVLGKNGRAVVEALAEGITDPERLAGLVGRRAKARRETLVEAFNGKLTDTQRFLLRVHLRQHDALHASIAEIDLKMEDVVPFRKAAIMGHPGISLVAVMAILAEIGLDMNRFPTAGHLVSWAGLCPANQESAGRIRSTRTRPSNPSLKSLLVQCAWACEAQNTLRRSSDG